MKRAYFLLALALLGCTPTTPPVTPTPAQSAIPEARVYRDFTFALVAPSPSIMPAPAVVNATLARVAPDWVSTKQLDTQTAQPQLEAMRVEAPAFEVGALDEMGEGLSAEQLKVLAKPHSAWLLTFRAPSGSNLKAVPQAERFVYELCPAGGVIADDDGGHFYSKDAWKTRMAAWPEVGHRIRFVPESDGVKTQGMTIFGHPELKVFGSGSYTEQYRALFTALLAQWLAEHPGDIPAKIDFDPSQLSSSECRNLWKTNCRSQPQLPVSVTISSREGRLVVDWDAETENECYKRLLGLTSKLLIPDDPNALQKASRRAVRELLTTWKPQYLKGLQPGESLLVKAAFRDADNTEWMWLEVKEWKGQTLTGLLLEDSGLIPKYRGGQKVSVSESDLFDYLLRSQTRRSGGSTDEILKAQQQH